MAHCTTHPHTCELQSWTVVTSVWRFMPNPKSMDICDRVGSIFIVYLYLRLLCSLPLPSTTCHVTSLVALNLRPLGLEKTDIMAKHLLKGRGHNNHTFEQQRRQIHQKQEWSMEFCCSCFRVQMHKPLVHDSQRASIYHQGTEASLLELRRFMTLRGLGFPDSPNTTGWPPLVFQGLARMDQLSQDKK